MARNNSFKGLKKVDAPSRELKQLQENIEQFVKPIQNCPIIDGVLIRDLCLEAGVSNEVRHKLGRKPIGWIITRKRQDSRIWDLNDTNTTPSKTLSIACSHACQVDIWIF